MFVLVDVTLLNSEIQTLTEMQGNSLCSTSISFDCYLPTLNLKLFACAPSIPFMLLVFKKFMPCFWCVVGLPWRAVIDSVRSFFHCTAFLPVHKPAGCLPRWLYASWRLRCSPINWPRIGHQRAGSKPWHTEDSSTLTLQYTVSIHIQAVYIYKLGTEVSTFSIFVSSQTWRVRNGCSLGAIQMIVGERLPNEHN